MSDVASGNIIHHGQNKDSNQDHRLHALLLGTALVAGSVILAPYVLPALGLGTSEMALEAITAVHSCTGVGSGLAAMVGSGLHAVPFIGPSLAEGGLLSAAASGVIGIGGAILGKFIEKKQDGTKGINWGRAILYESLATSALIALPSILTGISIGIVYISGAASGAALASSAATFLAGTIGAVGAGSIISYGLNGVAAVLPHLLTCGAALLPATVSFALAAKNHEAKTSPIQMHRLPMRVQPTLLQSATDRDVKVELHMDGPTSANVLCSGTIRLTDARTGMPFAADALALVHTQKMHLFVVDQSLKDYYHIHPVATDIAGTFTFGFTPATSNRYAAWTDITLRKDDSNHRLKTYMPAAINRNLPPVIRPGTHAEQDGMIFDWRSDPLKKDIAAMVDVQVTDTHGGPVTDLEPVMGAFAHLAGFSADGKTLIHAHPLGKGPAKEQSHGGPALRFHLVPETAGMTQFYLQIRRGGRDLFIPFGKQIELPQRAEEQVISPIHTHYHPAGADAAIGG